MVDKMIGNAYDTVKSVADNLPLLEYLANNMEALIKIANDLSTTSIVLGIAGNPGETVNWPYQPIWIKTLSPACPFFWILGMAVSTVSRVTTSPSTCSTGLCD